MARAPFFARDNEVWERDEDDIEHMRVVIRPIKGFLRPITHKLAKVCADALNEESKGEYEKQE